MCGFVAARIAMGPRARSESKIAAAAECFKRRTRTSKMYCREFHNILHASIPLMALLATKALPFTPTVKRGAVDRKSNHPSHDEESRKSKRVSNQKTLTRLAHFANSSPGPRSGRSLLADLYSEALEYQELKARSV
jgi:hypothetical protein